MYTMYAQPKHTKNIPAVKDIRLYRDGEAHARISPEQGVGMGLL